MFPYDLLLYLPRVFSFQLKTKVDIVGQNAILQHGILQHDTCILAQILEIRLSAAFEAGQVCGSNVSKLSPIHRWLPYFIKDPDSFHSKIDQQILDAILGSVYLFKSSFDWQLWSLSSVLSWEGGLVGFKWTVA